MFNIKKTIKNAIIGHSRHSSLYFVENAEVFGLTDPKIAEILLPVPCAFSTTCTLRWEVRRIRINDHILKKPNIQE